MREQFLFFLNEGERLAGMLHLPDKLPAPAIILCHGFTGNRVESHRLFVHAARTLCKEGFIAFRFDFRGSGESEGLFQSTTISREISDLKAALNTLSQRREVISDRIGVIGLSLGGAVALLTASRDERIKAICLWSTPADLKDLSTHIAVQDILGIRKRSIKELMEMEYLDLPSGDRIGREFILDALKHDILAAVKKISPRPLLIIHGTKDELVPKSHAEMLFERAGNPKRIIFIEGADHTFNRWDWQWDVIGQTVKWFRKTLGEDLSKNLSRDRHGSEM